MKRRPTTCTETPPTTILTADTCIIHPVGGTTLLTCPEGDITPTETRGTTIHPPQCLRVARLRGIKVTQRLNRQSKEMFTGNRSPRAGAEDPFPMRQQRRHKRAIIPPPLRRQPLRLVQIGDPCPSHRQMGDPSRPLPHLPLPESPHQPANNAAIQTRPNPMAVALKFQTVPMRLYFRVPKPR